MRAPSLLTFLSVLAISCEQVLTADIRYNAALVPRDGPGSDAPSSSNAPSASTTSQLSTFSSANGISTTPPASGLTMESSPTAASSSAQRSSSTSAVSSSTTGGLSTTSDITLGASATPISNSSYNGTLVHTPDIQGLPIKPTVTPAIAVAGAFMLISGVFYTLIGIKTKRLHIFFSTAYLFSLGVTVLIEYVMNPPISNGIQAAYFIAACATGLIFGAVAMVFSDVTEGLGCLLGGFCLSMWFLVLKSGGLLTSTAGKAIFIACFTVGTFGLYLSHYTRAYGLIGSTSFAGATVVVLGIDCFSRAGLKEFWLYIWSLNDALFPLNYQGPYPITRGIRVEIAGIIFLFLLGVMSQMKIWKIIKKRREDRAAEQRRLDQEKDEAEEALGRRLEADNQQERAMWDEVYGDKKKTHPSQLDSGIGTDAPSSTRKSSMSATDFRSIPDEGIEMHHVGDSRSFKGNGGKITVHVAQEDEIVDATSIRSSPKSFSKEVLDQDVASIASHSAKGEALSGLAEGKTSILDPKMTLRKTPKPHFVPLPFNVPRSNQEDDASSVATFAASDHNIDKSSGRFSGSSLMRRLSGRSQRRQSRLSQGISAEDLIVTHDDDKASSIAATVDDISTATRSAAASLRSASPEIPSSPEVLVTAPQTPLASVEPTEPKNPVDAALAAASSPSTAKSHAKTLPAPPGAANSESGTTAESTTHVTDHGDQQYNRLVETRDLESAETVQAGASREHSTSLIRNLPRGASKIEMAYRTNEWAKHLSRAETPETAQIKVAESQKAVVTQDQETAAPVDVRALQQTALTAEPALEISPVASDKMIKKSNNPYRTQPSLRQSRSSSQTSLRQNLERASSQTSLVSSNGSQDDSQKQTATKLRTNSSSMSLPRGLRSSSTPLVTSPLATSPIQEDVEATFPPKFTPSASHLMSQRDHLIRTKPSSTSLLRSASANSISRISTFSTPNASSLALQNLPEDDDDNVSLAQRKSMLQQDPSRLSLAGRTLSSGAVTPTRASSRLSLNQELDNNPYHQTAHLIHNSNPPHVSRHHSSSSSNGPADPAALTSWRASLAQLPHNAEIQQAAEIEMRRSQLMAEKQAERRSHAFEAGQREQRQSALGREMRRGSMMDAHREAMRRMQGQVNESLKK